jgi:hypothetical protein
MSLWTLRPFAEIPIKRVRLHQITLDMHNNFRYVIVHYLSFCGSWHEQQRYDF